MRLPLTPGAAVGVVAANGPAYARVMLDLLAAGEIAVPLRDRDDSDRIARAGVGRVIAPAAGSGWIEGGFASCAGAAPAQVSFSSGTEGAPKAVLLARDSLHDAVSRLCTAMEVTEEIREYIGVPVHHSFGYGRARAALAAGGRAFVPEKGFDMAGLRDMLRAGEVNAVSAVPSQWRIFLRNLDLFGPELAGIRWVEIGSQHMSAEEKSALRAALPRARIVQHYGLTEASRSTLLRIHDAPEDRLGSVGRAEDAVEIRLSPEGRIETRGPHVALGVDDGETYRPFGPRAWLTTSDLGRIEDGWLYYEGRADDVINCGGIKISPDAMEAAMRAAAPDAGDFGVLRHADPLRGDGVTIAAAPGADETALQEAARAYGESVGLDLGGALTLAHVETLPRTAAGKLRRKTLAEELLAPARRPGPAAPLPDGSRNMNPPGIGFWALVKEDYDANYRDLSHQGFWTLFVHRFGNWRMDVRPRLLRLPLSLLFRVLSKLCQLLCGMKLDYTVKVGRRVTLEHFGGMILGAREIGDDVILRQNTTIGLAGLRDLNAKPTIGRGVQVGAGAVIVGDIIIGEFSRIGANSVVNFDVPPHSTVIGNPGRIVKRGATPGGARRSGGPSDQPFT